MTRQQRLLPARRSADRTTTTTSTALSSRRLAARAALALLAALPPMAWPGLAAAQVGLAHWRADRLDQPVTLVYPTEAVARPTRFGPFTLDVAVDAAPSPGRRPLVVMSHGTAGSPLPDHALAARFARAGFVVAQVQHEGDNHLDQRLAGPASFQRRPAEVSRVIDALAADPAWAPRVDAGRVGVHGMSAGGVTGLSLAGAQWRTLDLVRHCQAHGVADEGFCFQGAARPEQRAERQRRYDRARFWPEFVLPAELKAWHGGRTPDASQADPRPDPRVAAVTLAVPVAAIFSAESLQRITIPVGLVSARDDTVLMPRWHSAHVLAHCRSCETLADLPAGHFDLLWPWPPELAQAVAKGQVRGGEPTPGFDPALRDAAQARIVAFHRRHLVR